MKTVCVGYCKLNNQNVCQGCYRTITEISLWPSATAQQKQTIIRQSELRKKQSLANNN
ncbi:DUF1289 domain-containing protein [Paraferrimonas sp. SM1919]|uniref:DUF1289 domain-containing protein n=1 Tax=Paraferrimonas sp. SM1919 TaxID=2662263 RepID=UPI0013D75FE2